jgi:hypothetical protein
LIGEYIPTAKNNLVAGLFKISGFNEQCHEENRTIYSLELPAKTLKTFI